MIAYMILRNSDMTEGRGPMIPTGVGFFSLDEAIAHIEKQSGIMGCRGDKVSHYIFGEIECWTANGHEVRTMHID